MKKSKKLLLTALSATLVMSASSAVALTAFADTATKDHEYSSKYDAVFEDFDRDTITDTVTAGGNGVNLGEKPYLHVNFTAGNSVTADDAIYKQAPKEFQNTNQVGNITFRMRSPEEDVELSELKFIVRVDDSLPLEEFTFEELNDEYLTTELVKPTAEWQDYKISLTNIYSAQKNIVGFHLVAADATAEGTLDIASVTYSSENKYLNDFMGGDTIVATANTTTESWWADSKEGAIVKRTVSMTGDSFTVVKNETVGKYAYAIIEAEGDVANLKVATTTDGTTWGTASAYDGYSVNLTGSEKGFKFIYEGNESVTVKRIYLTNNVIPVPAIAVPVIDASTAQVLEDFNVAQSGISGDYDAMSTAPEVLKAGLNYRLSYRHAEMLEIKDGCLVIDATNFVKPEDGDDWINFKFHSKSLAAGKYAVIKMKGEDVSLDKLEMSLMGSDGDAPLSAGKTLNVMKAGIDMPSALMTDANPYKDGDWYYIVIDIDESGLGVSAEGYSGLELNYRGTGKLYIDNVFFCDGIDVNVPNVEKDFESENEINYEKTVFVDGDYKYGGYLYIPSNGYGTTIEFDITPAEADFDISTLRFEFEGVGTYWVNSALKTTDGKLLTELTYTKDVATHVVLDLAASGIEGEFSNVHLHTGAQNTTVGGFKIDNVKIHTSTPVYAVKELDVENTHVVKDDNGTDNKVVEIEPVEGWKYVGYVGSLTGKTGVFSMDITVGADTDISNLRFEFVSGKTLWASENAQGTLYTADGKMLSEVEFEAGVKKTVVLDLGASGATLSDFHIHISDLTGSIKIENITVVPYVDYVTPAIEEHYAPKYAEQLAKLPAALDTVDPTVTISTATTAKVGDEITVAYTASDDMTATADLDVTVAVTKDGNAVTLNNNKFTAEEGVYTVTVTVRDANGNEASDTIQITVVADEVVGPTPAPSDGLSTGAIVGIVVGCVAAVVIAGVAVYFVVKKKKND